MKGLDPQVCGFLIGWTLGSIAVPLLLVLGLASLLHALMPAIPVFAAFGVLTLTFLVGSLLNR